MAKPRTPTPAAAYAPAPPLRWARASRERGHFCAHADHHGSDYLYLETPSDPDGTAAERRAAASERPVEKWACGACWPQGNNAAAVRDRDVRPGGPVAWPEGPLAAATTEGAG